MKFSTFDMAVPSADGRYTYFDSEHDIGLVAHGNTLEQAFESAAEAMFALMSDLSHVHAERTLPVSFIEANESRALMRWLNLLIEVARQHHLVFSEFRLQRERTRWWGCATGQTPHVPHDRGVNVKRARSDRVTVKQTDKGWEARCVVECTPCTPGVHRDTPAHPAPVE